MNQTFQLKHRSYQTELERPLLLKILFKYKGTDRWGLRVENICLIHSNHKKVALLMSDRVVFKNVQNQRGMFHYD